MHKKKPYCRVFYREKIIGVRGFGPNSGQTLQAWMTAVRDGDNYIVNGSKIGTTHTPRE